MRRLLPALVGAVVALTGCGGDGGDAATVARDFLAAADSGDQRRACAELAQATLEKLEKDEMAPCSKALGTLKLKRGSVTGTDVYVSEARVGFAGGEFAFLGRTEDGWKVSAAGCKPAGGGEQPYDCELEP